MLYRIKVKNKAARLSYAALYIAVKPALAQTVGFEPTVLFTAQTISSRSRYDLFDTAPYEIVGMQTTGKRIGYKVGITE